MDDFIRAALTGVPDAPPSAEALDAARAAVAEAWHGLPVDHATGLYDLSRLESESVHPDLPELPHIADRSADGGHPSHGLGSEGGSHDPVPPHVDHPDHGDHGHGW
jgi:hypothetical protein